MHWSPARAASPATPVPIACSPLQLAAAVNEADRAAGPGTLLVHLMLGGQLALGMSPTQRRVASGCGQQSGDMFRVPNSSCFPGPWLPTSCTLKLP